MRGLQGARHTRVALARHTRSRVARRYTHKACGAVMCAAITSCCPTQALNVPLRTHYTPQTPSVHTKATDSLPDLISRSMAATLNPKAPEFLPSSLTSTGSWAVLCEGEDPATEAQITAADLEELELAEAWVDELVRLEEEEEEHLVAVALRYAPHDKVVEIQRRCGVTKGGLKLRMGHRVRARPAGAAPHKAV